MNTRSLRRTRRQVASTLDDVIEKIEEAARVLGKEVDKAGGEVAAEIAALPEQLQGLRRSIVETVEPYRPPKRYRPYVQLGVLVMVVAAVIAIVMRRRQAAARSAATAPDQAEYQRSSGDDGQDRPISAAPRGQAGVRGATGLG
jgi:hypothetical protein